MNQKICEHIEEMDDELNKIREEKFELEEAFKRKMSELEEHLQAIRYRGSTFHSVKIDIY